jgi:hypothetical protein
MMMPLGSTKSRDMAQIGHASETKKSIEYTSRIVHRTHIEHRGTVTFVIAQRGQTLWMCQDIRPGICNSNSNLSLDWLVKNH